jgi:hypothetical protein
MRLDEVDQQLLRGPLLEIRGRLGILAADPAIAVVLGYR